MALLSQYELHGIIYNIKSVGSADINITKNKSKNSIQILSNIPIICDFFSGILIIKTLSRWNYQCIYNFLLCNPSSEYDRDYSCEWNIYDKSNSSEIISIILTGSGGVFIKDSTLISNNLNCQLCGSGDINIQDIEIFSVNNRITGSGSIHFSNSICNTSISHIVGSGSIYTPVIKTSSNCIITGSGDIKCNIKNGCNVIKNVKGSGEIFCEKLK